MTVAVSILQVARVQRLAAVVAAFLVTFAQAAAEESSPTDRCRATPAMATAAPGAVSASVRDATTGQPVSGALISWSFSGHEGTGSTDELDRLALQLPVPDRRRGESVELTIERNGFAPQTASVQACPEENSPLTLMLTPAQQFGTVQGTVTDPATGLGVPNAIVAILRGKFPLVGLSATTDRDGKYAIQHIGFAGGLTLQVTPRSPPCAPSSTRNLDMHQATVTENVNLPVSTTIQLRCPPVERGDLSGGSHARLEPAAPPGKRADLAGLPNDGTIEWQSLAGGIQLSDTIDAWHSGHINDILPMPPRGSGLVLVASDTGGVWSVMSGRPESSANPLSTNWASINMTSLAQGPDSYYHAYAGTYGRGDGNPGGVLWETDTSKGDLLNTLNNWRAHNTPCQSINHILVIAEFRRIMIACNNGIFWSQIPPAPSAHGNYNWLSALPAPGVTQSLLQGTFNRLAKGPGWAAGTEGTIVAVGPGTAPGQLFYWGGWQNGQLVLNAADVATGQGNISFGRSSLAACPLDPNTMYAVAADNSNSDLAAVWRTKNGGKNWAMVNRPPNAGPPDPATGHQGWYNQAIAVSPADCSTFVIGWEYAAFAAFDGGNSYPMPLNGAASPCGANCNHLHDDYHAVVFDPFDPQTLWFGTDGGLASASGVVKNGKPTFASYYNKHLSDLQFYHTSPSGKAINLVAGPLQDNAVVWNTLPTYSWVPVPGSSGDGAYTQFAGVDPQVTTDTLTWNSPRGPSQQSIWSGSGLTNPSTIPVADNNNRRDPAGITGSPTGTSAIRLIRTRQAN